MNVTFPGLALIDCESVRELCIKAETELRKRFKARGDIRFTATDPWIITYLSGVIIELTNDALLELARTLEGMKG